IRRQLIPLLQQDYNAQVIPHLTALGELTTESLQCLDQLADRVLKESVLQRTADVVRLDNTRMTQWPPALIRHALIRLWDQLHWPRKRLTEAHWNRLAALVCQQSQPGSPAETRFQLPGPVDVECRHQMTMLTPGAGGSCISESSAPQ
ncbi:MAG: hypothetical protein KDA85_20990, partial [Planctomycetaceae bacterium]|nr:hypothetical protein [Planctomycetaceae bacterium]